MTACVVRMLAALRHAVGSGEEAVLRFDDLSIDLAHRQVKVSDGDKLTPTEYELVKNLAANAGKVLTHRFLLRTVWGPAYENDIQYLRVYTGQIRQVGTGSIPAAPYYHRTGGGIPAAVKVMVLPSIEIRCVIWYNLTKFTTVHLS